MTGTDELVDQFWPDHTGCRDSYGPARQYEDEGVVCGCGVILGWPDETGTVHPDLAETANDPAEPPWATDREVDGVVPPEQDDPDGHLFDPQGAREPDVDDWPAQAAEDAVAAEQEAAQGQDGQVERWTSTELDTPVQPADPINAALKAIDPTRIYTPVDVEMQLVDLERRLEQGQVFQRVWEERAYQANVAYTLAEARALVEAKGGSAEVRKAEAILACEDEYLAKLTADHMVKAVRETMHNLRSMLSGYQSIARSIGASMSVAGAGADYGRAPARRN
jgi:hypothetical protein